MALTNTDLSLSIAHLLRSGTSAAHQTAENSAGAGWLTRGELDKDEYVRFLIMLWVVYECVASHPLPCPLPYINVPLRATAMNT